MFRTHDNMAAGIMNLTGLLQDALITLFSNQTTDQVQKQATGKKVMHTTFFFNSTLMALASLRNMAFPHSSSRSDVN